jgi:S-DNA-T family DNA segregation ATPase FtsK/SpoIIIE
MEILICDLKGLDFIEFENDYTKIADTLDSILDEIEQIVKKAYSRKELFKKHRVKNLIEYNRLASVPKEPYLILVVDELAELLLTYKGDETAKVKSKINNLITSVTQFGRAFGIHAILSTQYPKVEVVNGLIKSNCNYKIGLRMENEINTRVIGLSSPCHKIKNQYGYAYFKTYKGEQFIKI